MSANDNELGETELWANTFDGLEASSLRAALAVLAGLIDDPQPFMNCARAIQVRKAQSGKRILMADIVYEVCLKYGLTHAELVSPGRTKKYSYPRQEVMFRVFTECPHVSYKEMAKRLGGRDHTTCVHGVQSHSRRIGISYDDAVVMRMLAARETGNPVPLWNAPFQNRNYASFAR